MKYCIMNIQSVFGVITPAGYGTYQLFAMLERDGMLMFIKMIPRCLQRAHLSPAPGERIKVTEGIIK